MSADAIPLGRIINGHGMVPPHPRTPRTPSTPFAGALTKIVVARRFADYHAAIDGTAGRKWGCGKTIDEAVGALVRNHPDAFGTLVDISGVECL